MILCTIVVFLLIRRYGETLVAPPVAQGSAIAASADGADVFLRVLIALAAIIVTGRGEIASNLKDEYRQAILQKADDARKTQKP